MFPVTQTSSPASAGQTESLTDFYARVRPDIAEWMKNRKTGKRDIFEFINVGNPAAAAAVHAAVLPVASAVTNAIPVVECTPAPPDTAIEAAMISIVRTRLNEKAYGYGYLQNGKVEKTQIPRWAVQQHFLAVYADQWGAKDGHFLPAVTSGRIRDALRGGLPLYFRSAWASELLLVRFDIDTHLGQTDGEACAGWINKRLGGRGFVQTSARGWSVWIWLRVPYFEKTTDRNGEPLQPQRLPACKMSEMNDIRKLLHAGIGQLVKEAGFRATAEVQGGFVQTIREEDENKIPMAPAQLATGAMDGSTAAKLPVSPATMEDVVRFRDAIFDVNPRGEHGWDIHLKQLVDDCKTAAARAQQKRLTENDKRTWNRLPDSIVEDARDGTPGLISRTLVAGEEWDNTDDQIRRAVALYTKELSEQCKKSGKRKAVSRHIDDSGNMMDNDRAVGVRARQILSIESEVEFHARSEELLLAMNELYEENGLNNNDEFDANRRARFMSVINWMARTFDASKASRSGVIDTREIESFIHPDRLKHFNRLTGTFTDGAGLGWYKRVTNVSMTMLQLVLDRCRKLATSVKLAGTIPTPCLVADLRKLGHTPSGATLRAAMAMLRELGLIVCTDARVSWDRRKIDPKFDRSRAEPGKARRWSVAAKETAAKIGRSIYATAEAAGQVAGGAGRVIVNAGVNAGGTAAIGLLAPLAGSVAGPMDAFCPPYVLAAAGRGIGVPTPSAWARSHLPVFSPETIEPTVTEETQDCDIYGWCDLATLSDHIGNNPDFYDQNEDSDGF